MGYRQVHGDAGLGSISGTVSSLPAGYTLGEKRREGGVEYVLAYNAGNSAIDQGKLVLSTTTVGTTYSVTVTTITESVSNIVGWNNNATCATGNYFWMGKSGFPASLRASNISIATGTRVGPAANGFVITTDTAANYIAVNVGDTTTATAETNGSGGKFGRFQVWIDEITYTTKYT